MTAREALKRALVVAAVVSPMLGSCSGRHNHPSIETSYVIEGTMLVKIGHDVEGRRQFTNSGRNGA
jgi:hypothetical protein